MSDSAATNWDETPEDRRRLYTDTYVPVDLAAEAAATRSDEDFIATFESPAAKRLYRALDCFGGYWRDYDFDDFEDLVGLRDTLHEFVLEAHTAITELENK